MPRLPGPPSLRRPLWHLLRRGAHLLLPDPCLGCGQPLAGGEAFALCPACRGGLRAHRPGCRRCGAPLPGDRILPPTVPCPACRRRPPAFAALLSPWRYEPPLPAVVHALKFGGCGHLGERLAAPLGRWLVEGRWISREVSRERGHGSGWILDAVVPVPLHPGRRWRRGYNQAERIGRPLARGLGLPFLRPLHRRRPTRTQARLPRQRRRDNVAGAFAVVPGRRRAVQGRRLLLVDDVCTTGATMEAAARALRRAGARRVVAVTVARTPPPEQPHHRSHPGHREGRRSA